MPILKEAMNNGLIYPTIWPSPPRLGPRALSDITCLGRIYQGQYCKVEIADYRPMPFRELTTKRTFSQLFP